MGLFLGYFGAFTLPYSPIIPQEWGFCPWCKLLIFNNGISPSSMALMGHLLEDIPPLPTEQVHRRTLVRGVGVEPTRPRPQEPKSCTSTNSVIPGCGPWRGNRTPTYQSPSEWPVAGVSRDVEQVMGVEPTSSAWKADALAVVLHLRILGQTRGDLNPDPCEGRHLPFWRSVPWN